MKIGSISFTIKGLVAILLLLLSSFGVAQTDTLHLYYHHTQIAPPDSIQAKIEKWAKGLTGKHVDITVVAYFHKPEFKKFSQQRLDELFITLNRKARNVITIESMTTKKGQDYQRTMVDIIYKPTLSPEEVAAAKAKAEAEAAKAKEEEKKKKEEEKAAKDAEKKNKEGDKKSKTDVAAEQTVSGETKGDEKQEDGKKGKNDSPSKAKKTKPAVAYGNPGTKPAGKGTFITQSDVAEIKAAKLIVPKTDSPDLDSILTFAVKNFWTMNKNIEYGTMSYLEAKKLAKTDKSILIFIITDVKSSSLSHYDPNKQRYDKNGNLQTSSWGPRSVCSGASVMLEDGKGKIALAGYFPSYSEDRLIGVEAVAFGVSQMNSLLYNIEKYNKKNNMTFNRPFKQNAPRLKEKTLLLPDLWLSEKLELRDIPAIYEGKCKVVDYETWCNAILEKKDVAYTMVVPYPSGGKFIFLHYLMDASTGDVLFISQPRVAVDVYGINVSAANSGLIKEKNLKYYNDAFHMKENEEENEEKPAETAPEEKKTQPSKSEEKPEKKSKEKEEKKKKKD